MVTKRRDTHDKIEDLALYKHVMDLANYMYAIIESLPENERSGVIEPITESTLKIMKDTVTVGVCNDKAEVLERLNYEMKYLKALIRVLFLRKYISEHKLEVWVGKITNANNVVVGWSKKYGVTDKTEELMEDSGDEKVEKDEGAEKVEK